MKNKELKLIFFVITVLFAVFLVAPIIMLFFKSIFNNSFTTEFYTSVITENDFFTALLNSFKIAITSGVISVIFAFIIAYAVHYTALPKFIKNIISFIATLPMFLPTITYGFAIIYSFGKQGLITRILGRQLFDIYGFAGLLIGYVIYTIPVAFLLLNNTMQYIDKKTLIVSKTMGDNNLSTFWIAVLRPLLGTFAGAFIQVFFLCFTDFGIPASVGGGYDVIATVLYNQMLGGIPDFNRGAVIAMIMLIPSIGSICILQILEKFNIRYNRISHADLRQNAFRDISWGTCGSIISVVILSIFAVIFVVPLVEQWPYKVGFSFEHFKEVFTDSELLNVYINSLIMALLTALSSVIGENEKVLICSNGSYGERMTDICEHSKINYVHYKEDYDLVPNAAYIANLLKEDSSITHVAMVHSETTSGILNDIQSVGKVVKDAGKTFIVDAMSSFGGVDIPVLDWGIDFLISSANKCIQGVPGFSFIICRRDKLIESKGKARSLSLDLYEQWKDMDKDGKWRFTSPTHVVLAFSKAIDELIEEGGIAERSRRYYENNRLLIEKMKAMGFATYINSSNQGPIITTFFYPVNTIFKFDEFYKYIKERGYAIYPGKLTELDTFRVGNIGEIYPEDIEKLTDIIKTFLELKKEKVS